MGSWVTESWLMDSIVHLHSPPISSTLSPFLTWHNVLQDSIGKRNTKQKNKSVQVIVFHAVEFLASVKINKRAKYCKLETLIILCHCRPSAYETGLCLQCRPLRTLCSRGGVPSTSPGGCRCKHQPTWGGTGNC